MPGPDCHRFSLEGDAVDDWSAPAAARPVVRACAVVVTAMLAAGLASGAAAQAPSAPKAAPKAQPKSSPPPAAQPRQAAAPELVYVPWSKFCEKGPEANAKQVCFTGKYGRDESGTTAVMAMLTSRKAVRERFSASPCRSGQLAPGLRTTVIRASRWKRPTRSASSTDARSARPVRLIGQLKTGRGWW